MVSNCLSMSTRPNDLRQKGFVMLVDGWKKEKLDWSKRIEILNKILDQNEKVMAIMIALFQLAVEKMDRMWLITYE